MDTRYSVEKLLLDETFLDYCINKNSIYKKKWEEIILQYPAEIKVIEEAKDLISLLNPQLSTEEVTEEVNKIRKLVLSEKKKELPISPDNMQVSEYLYVDTKGGLRAKKIKRILVYGIVVAALSLGVIYLLSPGMKNKAEQDGLAEIRQYQSPRTERKQVELPDGTLVILNTNSNISISASFNKKSREVYLAGDAYFKVKRNPTKPFIVLTQAFSTTALGTSFYIHARDENQNYSVELLEGNVKLRVNDAKGEPAYLDPGEGGQWQQAESAFAKYKFDTSELKQWVSGTISFNKTPIRQAIKQLEKWYAVKIEMQRKNWEKLSITGEYVDVPLDDILKVICFSLSGEYKYSDNKIIIY